MDKLVYLIFDDGHRQIELLPIEPQVGHYISVQRRDEEKEVDQKKYKVTKVHLVAPTPSTLIWTVNVHIFREDFIVEPE